MDIFIQRTHILPVDKMKFTSVGGKTYPREIYRIKGISYNLNVLYYQLTNYTSTPLVHIHTTHNEPKKKKILEIYPKENPNI